MKNMAGVLVCILAILLSGCAVNKDVYVAVEGDQTIDVRYGNILKIGLEANATTGYIWVLTEFKNEGVLRRMGKYKYIHKSERIGAGGTQVYSFETLKRGQAILLFGYRRPWETGVEPVKFYTIRVNVH